MLVTFKLRGCHEMNVYYKPRSLSVVKTSIVFSQPSQTVPDVSFRITLKFYSRLNSEFMES